MKKQWFDLGNDEVAEPRERYDELMANPEFIEGVLKAGAEKARSYATPFLADLRKAVGIYAFA